MNDEKLGSELAVVEYRDDYVLVNISQTRLVTPQTGEQMKALVQALIQRGYKKVVLGFIQVEFMSSIILGALISISGKLRNIQGSLKIIGVSPTIKEIFTITNLDKILNIELKK